MLETPLQQRHTSRHVTVFVIFTLMHFTNAHLDVYLNILEVKKLLGLSQELYYVRQGVINEYALNFSVPVPAHIDALHFTWQSLGNRLQTYSISSEVFHDEAMDEPTYNISSSGLVPTVPETFSVHLPCTGRVAAEVNVTVVLAITYNATTTTLRFRRKKICLKSDDSEHNSQVVVDTAPTEHRGVGLVSAAVAVALLAVVAMFLPTYYVRNKKARRHQPPACQHQHHLGGLPAAGEPLCAVPLTYHPSATSASATSAASSCKSAAEPDPDPDVDRTTDLYDRIAEITIQRCRVRLRSVMIEGTFGRVYLGSYKDEDTVEEDVMVKTVADHASQIQISLLLHEGMAMYGLNHKNILPVLGVSIEDHTAPFLIYPYRNHTNLKCFLQKCKLCPEGVAHTLTTQEVVDMAVQITQGMQYLHRKLLLHRDLAARNCVVDDKLRVQITDQALARDLFPGDYHCLGDNENRPVKWLAPEALARLPTFSTASDVWAFGVLLWELATLAQQPYHELDPFEMAAYLADGYRLAQPLNCPDELFAIMAYCWAMEPADRPMFPHLQVCLHEFYGQLTRIILDALNRSTDCKLDILIAVAEVPKLVRVGIPQ